MDVPVKATLAAFRQAVAQLDILIEAYEAGSDA
jgi:hypothetical protein